MNISEKTKIEGIEKTHCKLGHIQHCLHAKGMHTVHYDYLGKYVARGKVTLMTKNGEFTAQFKVKNCWLEYLLFE